MLSSAVPSVQPLIIGSPLPLLLLALLVLLVLLELVPELLELLLDAAPPIPPAPPAPPIPPAPPVSPLLLDDELATLEAPDELEALVVVPGFSSTSPHAMNVVLVNVAQSNTNACFFIVVVVSRNAATNQVVNARARVTRKGSVATRAYHRLSQVHVRDETLFASRWCMSGASESAS